MSANINPFEHADAFDSVTIGGVQGPGIADVEEIEYAIKEDEKNGPGVDGATDTIQGRKLQVFGITLTFGFVRLDGTTPADAGDWDGIVKLISIVKPAKAAALPVDIIHPLVQLWGCKSCLILSAKGPKRRDDTAWTFELKCKEFRAPPKTSATKTPTQTAPPLDANDGSVHRVANRLAQHLVDNAAGPDTDSGSRTDFRGNPVAPDSVHRPSTVDADGHTQDENGSTVDGQGRKTT